MALAGTAFIDFEGKFDGLQRSATREATLAGGKAGSSFTTSFKSKMSGISQSFRDTGKSMMTAGAGMTAGITAPIALGFKKAFDASSDLNENLSKTRAVFGDASGEIERFARSSAKNVGLSRSAALDATSTFGNMFVQLGIGSGTAADMSTEMVTLASDFASFQNADISDVIDAQSAAFRGEYDAVQRFVPTINAASVEQRALADTGKTATSELTAQEKALAVQKLLMEGAGDAVGDFARTSDGAANKQRILKARFEDTAASIGTKLLPIGEKLLGWVGSLLEKFTGLSPTMQNVVLIAVGIAAAIGPVVGVVGALVTGIGFLISPIGLVVVAVAALAAGAVWAYTRFEGFRDVVDSVGRGIRTGFGAALEWITGTVLPGIQAALGSFIAGLQGTGGPGSFFTDLGEAVRSLAGWVTGTLVPAFQTYLWPILQRVGQFVGDNLKPILIGLGLAIAAIYAPVLLVVGGFIYLYQRFELFRSIVAVVVAVVSQLVQNAFQTMTVIFGVVAWTIGTVLVPAFQGWLGVARIVWSGVSAAISAAWAFVQPIFAAIVGFIRDWLIPRFRDFMVGAQLVWAAVSAAISAAWAFISPILGAVVGFIRDQLMVRFNLFLGVAQFVWSLVSAAIRDAWGIVQPIFAAVVGFIRDQLETRFNLFLGVAQTVWGAVSSAVAVAWGAIRPVFQAVVDFIRSDLAPVWDSITGAVSAAFGAIPGIISGALSTAGDIVAGFLRGAAGIADAIGLNDIGSALRSGAAAADGWGANIGVGGGGGGRRGGSSYYRASGGLVDGPIPVGAGFQTRGALAVVGEGRRQFPEFVIPTDPQYRSRALSLWESAGAKLMVGGGIVGGLIDKVKSAGGAVVDWGKEQVGDLLGVARRILSGAVEAVWPKMPVPGDFAAGIVPGAANKLRGKAIDLIRGKAEEEKSKAEMAAGSLAGGGFTGGGGGGAAGAYTPGMQAAKRAILGQFGSMTVGGYVNRNIAGTSKLSDHARYRAWDFMVGMGNVAKGNAIAARLLAGAGEWGLKYLIWNAQRNSGSGWGPYRHPSGSNDNTLMHRDHVHASFFARGGTLPMTVHRQPFDLGGVLEPGWNAVRNDLGAPERVGPQRSGPVVEFTGPVTLNDGVDIDRLSNKLGFAVAAKGL